jgi:hypothetical protein
LDESSGKIADFGGDESELNQDQLNRKQRRAKLKARVGGLVRFAEANGCIVYFDTLTMKKADTSPCRLNKYLNFFRARFKAAGLPFKYVWVVELQEKRYGKYGEKVPHWHLAIAAPSGTLPNVEFIEEAPPGQKFHMISDGRVIKWNEVHEAWGHGVELCQIARGSTWSYMAKYFDENLKERVNMHRRFGSSMLTWWCISHWAFTCVHEFWLAQFDVIKVWFTHEKDRRVLNLKVTDGQTMEFYKVPSTWVPIWVPAVNE